MGLCKCPKRKVTPNFCFLHRVNVCEHCTLQEHSKCIVQPYLKWLEDSSFSPNCRFCQQNMDTEICIRLMCYHIFHWRCFNRFAEENQGNILCPDCNTSIFPPENSNSPLALQLYNFLANAEWAKQCSTTPNFGDTSSNHNLSMAKIVNDTPSLPSVPVVHNKSSLSNGSSVPVDVASVSSFIESVTSATSRNVQRHESFSIDRVPLLDDVDDDKYKGKSASELLGRWLRNRRMASARMTMNVSTFPLSKWIFPAVIAIVVLFTVIHYFLKLGRESADRDISLDPAYNPNIRVSD